MRPSRECHGRSPSGRAEARRQFVGLVALLAIAQASALRAQAQDAAPPTSEKPVVIPDTEGAIAEIALHYDPELAEWLAPAYQTLLSALPADVRFQVVCPSAHAVREFNERWGAAERRKGRTIWVVDANRPITIWVRDRRIARQSLTGCFAAPSVVPRPFLECTQHGRNDLTLGRFLAQRGFVPGVVETLLRIEGGNVVSNQRHAFIGRNVFADNLALGKNVVKARVTALLGRPALFVGTEADRTPWPHVDMYLTPIDDHTVLVAGSAAGKQLRPADVSVARLLMRGQATAGPGVYDTGQGEFDAIARQLLAEGYRVVRLPAVVDPERVWMITYNNVLTERRNGRHIVYMPVYHVAELDAAAEAVYRSLGCEVRPVDVSQIFRFGGAVRCLANVVERVMLSGEEGTSSVPAK
jgi:hypothetical protein